MCYQCPVCGSRNCEEVNKLIRCLDCGICFRVYDMKEGFEKLMKSQKKTLDTLAGVNHTDKQVDD